MGPCRLIKLDPHPRPCEEVVVVTLELGQRNPGGGCTPGNFARILAEILRWARKVVGPSCGRLRSVAGMGTWPELSVANESNGALPLPEDDDALANFELDLLVWVSHVVAWLHSPGRALPAKLPQRMLTRC